ncbi:hypothetical protein PO883_11770 [Massilia sp. DJPM01]|uniref:hypothetical protein n=1 Tax=Massilia sp. DJPM01 TaxID=3024404 RepID=UPI00259F2B64|nr:hypothetical protein [Massilia sp. DJPM01]MDM5177869.1 hypothetical protein [Massilia sp. DJPM01]
MRRSWRSPAISSHGPPCRLVLQIQAAGAYLAVVVLQPQLERRCPMQPGVEQVDRRDVDALSILVADGAREVVDAGEQLVPDGAGLQAPAQFQPHGARTLVEEIGQGGARDGLAFEAPAVELVDGAFELAGQWAKRGRRGR